MLTDTERIELPILRDLARRAAARRPWLAEFCGLIEDEVDDLERRGALSAPRLDIATDIGMAVLEMLSADTGTTDDI